MPSFVAIGLFVNSLLLVLWATLFVVVGAPVLMYYEEKDLVVRFGDAYLEYGRRTGGLIPKFWKKKTKQGPS